MTSTHPVIEHSFDYSRLAHRAATGTLHRPQPVLLPLTLLGPARMQSLAPPWLGSSFMGVDEGARSQHRRLGDVAWLRRRYVDDRAFVRELARDIGCSHSQIRLALARAAVKQVPARAGQAPRGRRRDRVGPASMLGRPGPRNRLS